MIRTIKQHRPAYFSGFEDAVVQFETLEQLLAIPFVANFAQDMETPFHRFSLSDGRRLMAEYDEGHIWWVVGFIDDASGLDLPVWQPKRRPKAATA